MVDREIIVIKRNIQGEETWRYSGRVLEWAVNGVLLEARFNRPDLPFHGIVLGRGDRFLEVYFTDRWYNIFEIHDCQDDHLKGWYCNVSFPAELADGVVSYVDLALDLLIFPDGRKLVLDEDEFQNLRLPEEQQCLALEGLQQLEKLFIHPEKMCLKDLLRE